MKHFDEETNIVDLSRYRPYHEPADEQSNVEELHVAIESLIQQIRESEVLPPKKLG